MSFVDMDPAVDPPEHVCPEKLGGILSAFPPVPLLVHERGGFRYQPPPCGEALSLDPDFCLSTVKATPQNWRPEREAILGALQSAVNCSFGVLDQDIRDAAEDAINNNLSRAIETDLITALIAEAVPGGAGLSPTCALAEAAMFLASQGACQTGIIIGPVDWFTALTKDSLVWNGTYHTDVNGNIVLSHSVDNGTVFAFDGGMIIKVTDVQLLDEFMSAQQQRNDRIVRAEAIYAIAIAPCVVGSWTFTCCACATGGGGGGTQIPLNCATDSVEICNDAGNPITVTVSNFPADSDFDFEELLLCDDNGPFIHRSQYNAETGVFIAATNTDLAGAPYVPVGTVGSCPTALSTPTVRTKHKMASDVNPWTTADTTGVVTSITYSVISGTVNVTDSSLQVVAGIPAGLTATWNNDEEGELLPILDVTPQAPGDQTYVHWTELV